MIRIENLYKSFGSQVVLNSVDLEIPEGEVTAILGPSGTGKSVLLKVITGLELADSGEVWIADKSMTRAKSGDERRTIAAEMGILFQEAALFDSLTLFENVAFPLRHRLNLPEAEIISRCRKRIDEVGMSGYENSLPGEVSIGMRKRIGIARALVHDPKVIFFDEPNTGLDPQVGQEIYELIIETQKHSGFTGIIVSHEIPEVFQACSRVAMLFDGKIRVEGTVDEFVNSDNPAVRQFVAGDIDGPIRVV